MLASRMSISTFLFRFRRAVHGDLTTNRSAHSYSSSTATATTTINKTKTAAADDNGDSNSYSSSVLSSSSVSSSSVLNSHSHSQSEAELKNVKEIDSSSSRRGGGNSDLESIVLSVFNRHYNDKSSKTNQSPPKEEEQEHDLFSEDPSLKFRVIKECMTITNTPLSNTQLSSINNLKQLIHELSKHTKECPLDKLHNPFNRDDTVREFFESNRGCLPPNLYFKNQQQ
jgi:hypothetical protein